LLLVKEANAIVQKVDPVVHPVAIVGGYSGHLGAWVVCPEGPVLVPTLGKMVKVLGKARQLRRVGVVVVDKKI
jgi:hypothetical protein